MSLAFHLLAHKNPAQVARLVQALGLMAGDVCIVHYDKSRPAVEIRELHARLAGQTGVVFQPRRHVVWGGWSLIQAQLDGMQKLRELARREALTDADTQLLALHGDAPRLITEQEQEQDCDLIVVGKRGLHFVEELLLGSTTLHVLMEAQGEF